MCRFVHVCVRMCIDLHVCVHVCVCVYPQVHVVKCVSVCLCMYVYVCVSMCMCVCVYPRTCMYVSIDRSIWPPHHCARMHARAVCSNVIICLSLSRKETYRNSKRDLMQPKSGAVCSNVTSSFVYLCQANTLYSRRFFFYSKKIHL